MRRYCRAIINLGVTSTLTSTSTSIATATAITITITKKVTIMKDGIHRGEMEGH